MWIFTVNGFFTVIQDRKDPAYVWLRSRLREDIERNFPGVIAEEHPGADYLYRIKLPREQVAQRLFELAMENNVTSHFKDVMIRTASKPEFGNRSSMLYGVWNAGAAMQPIPPYSKNPRPKIQPKTTWKPGDRTTGTGQGTMFGSEDRGLYGGAGAGYRGSDFDWDSKSWSGGPAAKDPARPSADTSGQPATDDEFDAWWAGLTDAERNEYLDETEAEQRRREEAEEDFGAAARWAEFRPGADVEFVQPAPLNRPGTRRERRAERKRRKNRHNQEDAARRAERNREGMNGLEARNRQAYLDKHGKGA